MKTIHAIYENGVFKPTEPVDLPEHSRVTVEPEPGGGPIRVKDEFQDQINEILSRRYDSGDPFGAERHNEHQP